MRISDWSSDVCSSDLGSHARDGVEQSLVVGQAQLPALGRQATDCVAQQPVRRAVGVANGARTGAGIAFALLQLGQVLGLHHRLDVVQLDAVRSEEHTSELQSLMRISYAVFCLKK